jgi:hypothetical protein
VVTAIFDTAAASDQLHSSGRMQGFGSDGAGSAGSEFADQRGYYAANPVPSMPKVETGAYSSGCMQGFGNPQFPTKANEPSKWGAFAANVASGLKDGLSKVSALRDTASDGRYANHGSFSGSHGPECDASGLASCSDFGTAGQTGGGGAACVAHRFIPPATSISSSPFAPGSPHKPGKAGGGWGAPAPEPTPAPTPAPAPAQPRISQPQTATNPGDFEAKLVDEITSPGGVRAAVPREDLRKFCETCESLSGGVVSQLLLAKLNAPEWQSKLKALAVIEAMLKADPNVKVFFQEHTDVVTLLLGSAQASLKEKAAKVLQALGFAEEVLSSPVYFKRLSRTSPADAVNLLKLDDALPPAPEPDPELAAQDPLQNALTNDATPATPAGLAVDLFGSLQLNVSVAAAPASPALTDLEILMNSTPSAATPALACAGSEDIDTGCLSSKDLMAGMTMGSTLPASRMAVDYGNGAMNRQVAMMQEQMAIMQQTILQQQMMMGPAGGPWGPPPASVAAMPQLSRQSNPVLPQSTTDAPKAFGFINNKPSEAFDFVGNELSKNMCSL